MSATTNIISFYEFLENVYTKEMFESSLCQFNADEMFRSCQRLRSLGPPDISTFGIPDYPKGKHQ